MENGIKQCKNVFKGAESALKRARLSEICQDFKIILKIAELAIQVEGAQSSEQLSLVNLAALDELTAMGVPACFWKPIVTVIKPILPCKFAIHRLFNLIFSIFVPLDLELRSSTLFEVT